MCLVFSSSSFSSRPVAFPRKPSSLLYRTRKLPYFPSYPIPALHVCDSIMHSPVGLTFTIHAIIVFISTMCLIDLMIGILPHTRDPSLLKISLCGLPALSLSFLFYSQSNSTRRLISSNRVEILLESVIIYYGM